MNSNLDAEAAQVHDAFGHKNLARCKRFHVTRVGVKRRGPHLKPLAVSIFKVVTIPRVTL